MSSPLPSIVLQLIEASSDGFHPPPNGDSADLYALRHGLPFCVSDAERRQGHVAHVMDALAQLLELAAHFERAGIPHAWLKGPVFAQWLYADPGARRFSDLDVLVRPADRDRALAVLQSLGFEQRIPSHAGDVIYASIGACPLARHGRIGVDLHWQLAGRRFPRTLTAEEVIDGARPVTVAGRELRAPRPEHATVMHLSHAAKHLFYALEHTLSTSMLMRRHDIDWSEVRRVLSDAGAVRTGAAGLQLAHELFGVEVPEALAADATLTDVRDLCQLARRSLSLPPDVFPDRRLDRQIQLLCFDRQFDRWAYDLRRWTEPTQAEWEWLRLPSRLSIGYWPLRLIRLGGMALGVSNGAPRERKC